MEGLPKLQSRSRDPFPTPFDLFFSLVPLLVNLLAKFEVSRLKLFQRYGGGPTISKVGHVTPSRPPLT